METTQQPIIRRKRLNQGQGLAEYSLIISLVALMCVGALVILGRSTKSTIYKVTCAAGSKDAQCSCINEKITAAGSCLGSILTVSVTTSCTGSSITVTSGAGSVIGTTTAAGTISSSPACPIGSGSFAIKSQQPDGTVKNYTASPS